MSPFASFFGHLCGEGNRSPVLGFSVSGVALDLVTLRRLEIRECRGNG